jgi:hypothetical protein
MGFRMVYKLLLLNILFFLRFFAYLMLKIDQNFFSSRCDNSYTIQKPMSNLVDLCCFQKKIYGHLDEKKLKNTKMMNFG